MYLASKINRRVDQLRGTLVGPVALEVVEQQVQQSLRPWGVKVTVQGDETLTRTEFVCSGSYDYTKRKQPIDVVLHFNHRCKNYVFTRQKWRDFRFKISQLLQHELIHKHQYSHRVGIEGDVCLYYDIKAGAKSDKEHMDYLAELDEIDAYAHDIAMEIRYFYPQQDPYQVLRNINDRPLIWSWQYYCDAFRDSDEDWSDVRNRLLKKTYQWLPYTS